MTDNTVSRAYAPVVALIGIVLVLYGVLGVLREGYSLWVNLVYLPASPPSPGDSVLRMLMMTSGLYGLSPLSSGVHLALGVVSIAVGLGLRRGVGWAWRAAVPVLVALFAFEACTVLRNTGTIMLQGGVFGNQLAQFFLSMLRQLVSIAQYGVYLLFMLAAQRTMGAYNGKKPLQPRGVIERLAILDTPVVTLVGVYLLCKALPLFWFLHDVPTILVALTQKPGDLDTITWFLVLLMYVAYLVAGVSVFLRSSLAPALVTCVLLIYSASSITVYILNTTHSSVHSLPPFYWVYISLHAPFWIAIHALLLIYYLRHRHPARKDAGEQPQRVEAYNA